MRILCLRYLVLPGMSHETMFGPLAQRVSSHQDGNRRQWLNEVVGEPGFYCTNTGISG